MIYKVGEIVTNTEHPHIQVVSATWIRENKYSSSKWKKLAIDLFNNGFEVHVRKKGTGSTYLTLIKNETIIRVRISNHSPVVPKKPKKISRKFGAVGVLVGPGNLSCKEAFNIIVESF